MIWWIPIVQAIAGNSNSETGRAVGSALSFVNSNSNKNEKQTQKKDL